MVAPGDAEMTGKFSNVFDYFVRSWLCWRQCIRSKGPIATPVAWSKNSYARTWSPHVMVPTSTRSWTPKRALGDRRFVLNHRHLSQCPSRRQKTQTSIITPTETLQPCHPLRQSPASEPPPLTPPGRVSRLDRSPVYFLTRFPSPFLCRSPRAPPPRGCDLIYRHRHD